MSEQKLTGYPSIDKPWLKYYSEEAINTPLPECTIYEQIRQNNQDNLNRVALDYYGNKFTYKRLLEKIDKVAGALAAMGVKQGDIVSACLLNTPEAIFLIYALNKLGAVANLMYVTAEAKELCAHLNETHSNLFFIEDMLLDAAKQVVHNTLVEHVVVTNMTDSMSFPKRTGARLLKKLSPKPLPKDGRFIGWRAFMKMAGASPDTESGPEAPAAIVYSGGTTGGAKGVILTNRSIVAVAWQYVQGSTVLDRSQLWSQSMPLFIGYGISASMHIPLIVGMTLTMSLAMSESISQMCKHKPNHIIYGPFMWEQLADENPDMDLSCLTAPISGGDTLPESVEEKINQYLDSHNCPSPLLNGYGMTEAASAVAVNYRDAHEIGSVGVPFVKNLIAAFDTETGKELTYEHEGELCICTPSMMKEYLNNPEETANILRLHEDGKVWVHTGDLGYINESGFVHFSGRIKRYFAFANNGVYKKVYSLDVERALLAHPAVENCVVVPVADDQYFQIPKAYIIAKGGFPDQATLEAQLRVFCEEHLEFAYLPRIYEFVEAFPRTKIGKVDYKALERESAAASV